MTLDIRSRGTPDQQDRYRRSVAGVVEAVQRTRTGRIVIAHITASPRRVTIEPWTGESGNAEAVPESEVASGSTVPGRTSAGTNTHVRFSADRSAMPPSAPQGSADEVLVHELGHALRQISGAEQYERVGGGLALLRMASYGNTEEFFAAMVASVHSSELGRAPLANHGRMALRDPGLLQRPPFSTRLRQARARMPGFCAQLAAIPPEMAAFNPFRDVP